MRRATPAGSTRERPSAARPDWTCGGCGLDRPCRTRWAELIAEYEGAAVSLGLYMAAMLIDACQDLPERPAGWLVRRFLVWVGDARTDHDC
jgi:hypothetical protein